MQPIKTNEANFIYVGPRADIADLPCRTVGRDTFSVWVLTDEERAMVAAGAHIRMGIHGARPIPATSLQVVANAGPYARVPAPCGVCGREVDDPVHATGPDTHAYRCDYNRA